MTTVVATGVGGSERLLEVGNLDRCGRGCGGGGRSYSWLSVSVAGVDDWFSNTGLWGMMSSTVDSFTAALASVVVLVFGTTVERVEVDVVDERTTYSLVMLLESLGVDVVDDRTI